MSQQLTEHSKKLRQKTAAAFTKAKLSNGEYRQLSLQGKSEDIAIIDAAIAQAGGSRVQALKTICQEYLNRLKT